MDRIYLIKREKIELWAYKCQNVNSKSSNATTCICDIKIEQLTCFCLFVMAKSLVKKMLKIESVSTY